MTAFPNVDIANKWAKQVVLNKIPACKWVISPNFYLPHETVFEGDEKALLDRYQKWDNMGLLDVHEGAETDLDLVASDLISDSKSLSVVEVPYDNWGARLV